MLLLAKQLGSVNYFTEEKERELLDLKKKWGWSDPRNTEECKNCDICANDIFRDSWQERRRRAQSLSRPARRWDRMRPRRTAARAAAIDQEALVQMITERVMAELAKR